jgi:4a-hydroxytetrahydrobiopterin dehydratase
VSRPGRLTDQEIQQRLGALPGWSVAGGALHRELKFENFSQAFGFMARAALVAEKMDHHPSWSNVYAQVTIDLSTHDAGGITELDFRLAAELDKLV